jgi:glycosyltransferase involved in cell wall biosynthesis
MLTIITPTLNAAATLARLLASSAKQRGIVEHLIVDGGSTDGTQEIVAQFPHATLVEAPGTSIYEAQNVGIQRAQGDWIYVIGADDVLQAPLADLIERAGDADFIRGCVRLVTPEGRVTHPATMATRQQAFIYRKALYDQFGLYDGTEHPVYADVAFQKLLAESVVKQYTTREVLATVKLGGYSANTNDEYPL